MRRVVAAVLLSVSLAAPAAAQAAPERSATTRLDDRRVVTIGTRAYQTMTAAGRYPAMGFHTRGEMGGIWSQPIKLLDGLWFGIDGQWIGEATRFTSGYGYTRMDLPGRPGLSITRTDFVPDGPRGLLVGLTFRAAGAEQRFVLDADAHSELMSIYPWGETKPTTQKTFNLADRVAYDAGARALVFTEQGRPSQANAPAHDWAAAVGTALPPGAVLTGSNFRGPQTRATICPASGPGTRKAPERCDDTAYGRGRGGRLSYQITVPAGGETSVWFGVAGSESGAEEAKATLAAILRDPAGALAAKVAERERLAGNTRLSLPGDPLLAEGIELSKQNLSDSVQDVRDLELREVNAGTRYPPARRTLPEARFLGAGFPDYPWIFATDAEYTAFASVALGQFEPIKDHLRALRDASRAINGGSGKVVHEVITEGSVFFGALRDAGNTDETAKFPSTVALLWRWTGDDAFLREMYSFTRANMRFIVNRLDEDDDGWPEGLGNVEREGMGEEKLDNAVYTIRGLFDLADLARARGDVGTRRWAQRLGNRLRARFDPTWWDPRARGYADSLEQPDNERSYQRHWIGVTPMEVELTVEGRPEPGLALRRRALSTLRTHERSCYSDEGGLFHTGRAGCDGGGRSPSELQAFTLNTSIMAVGEGNYGRLGSSQQRRFTTANVAQQLPGTEQPGAMPEIASPSPLNGSTLDRPFNERPMVLQAWGAYGTAWPVVRQQLGVSPDLGRGRLEVVPQVPGSQPIAGSNIRLGDEGSVDVRAARRGTRYETTVTANARLRRLRIGHVLPLGARNRSVRLNGKAARRFDVRRTNRGQELTLTARTGSAQALVVDVER